MYPGYYFFQIVSTTKCYISTGAGKYELHISCLWQSLVKSLRMCMWSKIVAFVAIFLGPSFKLPLERVYAIDAIVPATSERIPLVNRQLIHIVFLFHLITSPKRHNWSNKQVPVIHRNRIQGIMACQAACITSSRSLSMRPLLSISILHLEILQNLTVQPVHQFLW